ncbi:MAG: hypothetical protein AB7T22_13815 [Calditrichaceae bacterium]
MKTKLPAIILLLTIAIFTKGCLLTYGDYTGGQFTSIANETCDKKADKIYLFFEGEQLDFEYKKIGLVEANGDASASNAKVFNHLRYQAWKNCANGIINISDGYKNRDQGVLLSPETRDTYSSKVFKGIAVKIKTDSAFISMYGADVDTSFVNYVLNDVNKVMKEKDDQVNHSIIGGLALAVLTIALAIGR